MTRFEVEPSGQREVTTWLTYALNLLLWAGFLLQGAKTPIAFFLWATLALVLCGRVIWNKSASLSLARYWKELLLFFCIAAAQMFSEDPSSSHYLTFQSLVFLLLWVAFKSDVRLSEQGQLFYRSLRILGTAACVMTLCQYLNGAWPRSHGFFPVNPIFNATWLACIGVALISRAVVRRKDIAWDAGLGVFFLATVASGPMRSLAIAILVGLLYALKPFLTRRRIFLSLSVLFFVVALVPSSILYRRLRLNEGNYRNQIWNVALQAVKQAPITGWGPGNFEMAYQRYAFPVETDTIRYARTTGFAHNEFLQVASEYGFLAFVIILAGTLGLCRIPILTPATQIPAKAGLLVLCVTAAMNVIWHLPILLFLTLCWAAFLSRSSNSLAPPRSSHPRWTRVVLVLFLVVTEVSLGWAAWREHWAERGQWARILRMNPSDAWAWRYWAGQQGEKPQALAGYLRATELVPAQVYFHEAFARALEASNQPKLYPAALVEYRRALDCAPSRAINYLAIGRLLFNQGHIDQALAWFQEARRIEPHYWESDLWIARCQSRQGQNNRAVKTLQRLKIRHHNFVEWRQTMALDLPSPNDPADYDRLILGYNPQTVELEMNQFRKR